MRTKRVVVWAAAALLAGPALAQQGMQQQEQKREKMGRQVGAQPAGKGFQHDAPKDVLSAIEKRTREFEQAYNKHDARKLADFFTRDATYLGADGQRASGRGEIEQLMRSEHSGPARNARASLTLTSVRSIDPKVVVVDAMKNVQGLEGTGPGGQPLSHVHMSAVLLKEGKEWKVAALRSFPMPAGQMGVGGAGTGGLEHEGMRHGGGMGDDAR